MRSRLIALPFAAACGYGPTVYDYEARVVVGIEAQDVPVAAFAEVPAWVSLRGSAADVAYPLVLDGDVLHLQSPFTPAMLATAYDPWWSTADTLATGALAVALGPSGSTETEPPPLTELRGRFSLVVSGGEEPIEISVILRPELEPCGFDYTQSPSEVRPVATLDGGVTCVDGTQCIPPGTRVDPDERTIFVAPFRIFARVQRYCGVSSG